MHDPSPPSLPHPTPPSPSTHHPSPPSPSSHSLPDLSLTIILAEWSQPDYDPPNTDLPPWINSLESLSNTYGIPDTQRPSCAIKFIKPPLRTELEKVLTDAQTSFGPIPWSQFKIFMTAFDHDFRERWDDLPFYKKHPKSTGTALGIVGGALLAPVAIGGVLSVVGFTSTGVAAGSLAATIQSIVYGGATRGLFSLLQSAGATMILPSLGTIVAGAATTGAGIAVLTSDPVATSIHLSSPNQTTLPNDNKDYLLTPLAIQAILKSWNISTYDPPKTVATRWLTRIHSRCELYGIPVRQRALCAIHHMSADCREAANAAACHDMSWDQFKSWLLQYDTVASNNSS